MTRPVAFTLIAAALILLTIALVALWLATEAAADMPTLRDEVDRYRAEVAKLTETVHRALNPVGEPVGIEEQEAPRSAFPQVNLEEPATQPIVLRVPTDTVDQAAAIDVGLRKLHGATASGGRHRMPT